MDELDQEILMHLKEDSRRSVTEISKAVGRSHSATRVRLANLIDSGIIGRFTIELADYDDNNVSRAFVDVVLPHGAKADRIASVLSDIEEVTDMSLVTGRFNCQVLIQCEAVSRIQFVAEVIQERLGAKESRVRVVTGSIPGYPKVNTPVFLSHFTKGNSETEDNGNTPTTPSEEPVIAKASPNVTPTSSTGWALVAKPSEEKIVKEIRPVIGA